jgi:hypothetical protein
MPQYPPSNRQKRRYPVDWQMENSGCAGFTKDISPTGMFVCSPEVPEIGRTVALKVLLPEGQRVQVRGTVVRAYRAPADLGQFLPSGFGVRLNEAPEEYFQLLAHLFNLRLRVKKDRPVAEPKPS